MFEIGQRVRVNRHAIAYLRFDAYARRRLGGRVLPWAGWSGKLKVQWDRVKRPETVLVEHLEKETPPRLPPGYFRFLKPSLKQPETV